jgi:F-type H+-transporting ATPase subunit gamma
MANTKDIQKRIKSVTSTHKITRTMEMVATSRFKRAVDQLHKARPFADALRGMLAQVAGGAEAAHPLLESRGETRRVALLLLTTNRGLCGALNSNLIRKAQVFLREHEEEGREADLHVVGKKGSGYFRFIGRKMASSTADLSDRPGPDDADRLLAGVLEDFLGGRVDEVHVGFPSFKNAAEQPPVIEQLLPLAIDEAEAEGGKAVAADFIFEPEPEGLLAALLPLFLRNVFFRYLLEMAASEHGARRTAMKAATDSAQEMIDSLTLTYNKARQAQITTELLEVVSGAEALK